MAKSVHRNEAVLIIGLGRFGSATAQTLNRLDRDVLAIDSDMTLVQQFSDQVTQTVQCDATFSDALIQIGASEFSTAVVAVGSSIEASVLITANLVDLGIPQIWAKAISSSHGQILERIGAHHVIYPEAESGKRVAHLLNGHMLDYIQVESDFALAKVNAPQKLIGRTLHDSAVRQNFGVTITAIKQNGGSFVYATSDSLVSAGDQLLVSGPPNLIEKFSELEK